MNIQLMQVRRVIYIFGKKSDSNLNPYFICEVVLQMDIQICKYMVLFYFIFYPEKLEFESEHFTLSIRSDCKWIFNYYASMKIFFLSNGKAEFNSECECIIFETFSFGFKIYYIAFEGFGCKTITSLH